MCQLLEILPAAVAAVLPAEVTASAVRLGCYQVEVLRGRRAWSGADLAGRAKSYAGRYRAARESALAKVEALVTPHGVDLYVRRGRHGRLSLAWEIAGLPLAAWLRAAERPGLAGMAVAP